MRNKTREISIGNLKIGSNNPIPIQSMTNTDTTNIDTTIKQIHELEEAGCEIIRISAPTIEAAKALKEIKEKINIPLVADIHFDYKIALEAAKHADKLRINPGNIGDKEKIKLVVDAAKENKIPIRIGVNLGSLEKDIFQKYGYTAEAMVESALRHIKILENLNFHDIVVSLKASDVNIMVDAYRLFAKKSNYPLHLGVTEAGSKFSGTIKSAIGIGTLLEEGIGDTIRVSLSDNPTEEVKVAKQILKTLGLKNSGIEITSCPTCARSQINVIKIVEKLENQTEKIKKPVHVAVMGCAVNGPGESKKSDIGIVGAPDSNLLYKKGEIVTRIKDDDILDVLLKEIDKF
ncbi:MAG: flavodoxin-dependent (E)-4-hydroxy-3-methylbut-2-enyl-diphosphate synthase [Candidatus Woesearchaeota archaeon]|jgi:(E)-4-hydroxy-3-methylbut-2-enyl-diphosphate synthase|nr:flavodoxin-dependent (E)-4-hydroxy-3-methylbut-2-enyl-diphosphate synthase [Candidatus Woesearchaeota archaeon]MDP7622703.1 flavodoxin-dependent (E)-4-hydroxy-3-methylbut-2-enyl-diphosphate synthase [Candidatus Woesearchaeota archaeon]HJN57044.1 flavodoxin-dependent (E)-4-hydroxy-3-methylbut-2-enyl-diphosphate synthase [Candidatus Woesearchaeota archaeon]|tara:strand:+ start:12648 stop:13688 length:1041 start_codon:yes stop_codon:yes gene_type:complete